MVIIKKIDIIHKCLTCKKIANYKLSFNKMFLKDLCLCKECLNDLYLSLGKMLVPRAIENINKKIKIKE